MSLHLPDPIYRMLPYLYLGTGLLTLFTVESNLGVFSGIVLIVTAFLVGIARYQYRKELMQNGKRTAPQPADGDLPNDGLIKIRWRPAFESGHTIIDTEHRKLFALGNELLNSALEDKSQAELLLIFGEVIRHIDEHFHSEESVLTTMNHPISESHKEIHRSLLAKAKALFQRFENGQMPTRDLVSFIIYDLITDHLVKEDANYFEGVRAKMHHILNYSHPAEE